MIHVFCRLGHDVEVQPRVTLLHKWSFCVLSLAYLENESGGYIHMSMCSSVWPFCCTNQQLVRRNQQLIREPLLTCDPQAVSLKSLLLSTWRRNSYGGAFRRLVMLLIRARNQLLITSKPLTCRIVALRRSRALQPCLTSADSFHAKPACSQSSLDILSSLSAHLGGTLCFGDRTPHRPAMNNPIEGLEGLPDAQKNALMTQIEEMQVRDR